MTARRRCRNAAAQEALHHSLIGAAWGIGIAAAIGLGIGLAVHWDEIIFDLRLRAIVADIRGRE